MYDKKWKKKEKKEEFQKKEHLTPTFNINTIWKNQLKKHYFIF